jgi:hypothetical protein
MTSAAILRAKIEADLADRIPSALTPGQRILKPVATTGVESIDDLLEGGLPLGGITEIVGPESSGRTSLAISFVARMTQAGKVCAWIDVSDALDPESAASNGVLLDWLLWVRCGSGFSRSVTQPVQDFAVPGKYLVPSPVMKGLHGGGCGPHPRSEIKGLSEAVGCFLQPEASTAKGVDHLASQSRQFSFDLSAKSVAPAEESSASRSESLKHESNALGASKFRAHQPWSRMWSCMEQALRVTDLLLQAGGFSAIVLDMGSIAPAHALRVPLATWFRYRAAAERSQASILLLTQHSCAKSSAELLLRLEAGRARRDEPTLFTGMDYRLEVSRERYPAQPKASQTHTKVVPLRKPPQSERKALWSSRSTWAGSR